MSTELLNPKVIVSRFSNENDFATMNFAIAGMLCSLFAVPVVIWTRSRQIEQENKHADKVSRDTETEM